MPHLRRSCFALLLLISLGLFGCAGRPPAWTPTQVKLDDRVELPCEFPSHGLPVVSLERSTANDEGAVSVTLAIVDTGAATCIVTPKYAKSHSLDVRNVGALQMEDAFKQRKNTPEVAHINSLKVGAASFENFDVLLEDLKSMQQLSDKIDL